MTPLQHRNLRKITMLVLLIWATVFFCFLNQHFAVNVSVVFLSALCAVSIIIGRNIHFTAIYLAFVTSFVLYGYMLVNNLPIWLIMLSVLGIFLYIFGFMEQKVKIRALERPIYLFIFSLLTLETFLFLGYFLISPINRSLLLSSVVYIIYGFCDAIFVQTKPQKITSYILVFLLIFVTMMLTASWGQI